MGCFSRYNMSMGQKQTKPLYFPPQLKETFLCASDSCLSTIGQLSGCLPVGTCSFLPAVISQPLLFQSCLHFIIEFEGGGSSAKKHKQGKGMKSET